MAPTSACAYLVAFASHASEVRSNLLDGGVFMPRVLPASNGFAPVAPPMYSPSDVAIMPSGERRVEDIYNHQQQMQQVDLRQISPVSPVSPGPMFTEVSANTCAGFCGSPQMPDNCAPYCSTSASDQGHCHPQCTWKCESPVCDEVCEPECEAPQCETRCQGIDTSGCRMECDEPQCAVVCPERQCETGGCPACSTTCSEPVCKLKCPDTQPCQNICEHPNCRWKCKAPEQCPAPRCSMECESPPACMSSTYRELPPLAEGESSVRAFAAPLSHSNRTSSSGAPVIQAEQSLVRAGETHSSKRMVEVPVHTNKSI